MPVTISDEDYKEYMTLQHNVIFQQKLDSIRGLKYLKEDIDIPMRRLVAMFALLDCEPLWSCCGFDYDGQPIHKTHEYGNTYIALKDTQRTRSVMKILYAGKWIQKLNNDTDKWEVWMNRGILYLRSDFDYFHRRDKYPWSMNNCIHFPELAVIKIQEIEKLILSYFEDEFKEMAIVSDTNRNHKIRVRNWQYPALEDWTVTLSDIL